MKESIKQFFKELTIALELARINLKLNVEGTYLGLLWYILDPIIFFVIIIFVRNFIMGADFSEYPLYLIIGLILYQYFSNVTTRLVTFSKSTVEYVKKSDVSYNCLFMSKIIHSIYLHLLEILILTLFVVLLKGSILGIIAYLVIILFFFTLFVSGVAFFISIIGAYFQDFVKLWQIFIQIFRFITPIFLIFDKTSAIYQLNLLNPLFYFIEVTRQLILFNSKLDISFLIIAITSSIIIFFTGYILFKKFNKYFPELAE